MAWTGNFYIYFIFHFHPVLGCYATQHETFYIYIYVCLLACLLCFQGLCFTFHPGRGITIKYAFRHLSDLSESCVGKVSHWKWERSLSHKKCLRGEGEKKIPASFIFIDLLFILRRRKKEKRITYEQNVPEYHFLFYSGPRCFLCNVLNRHNSSPQSRPAGEDEEWYNWLFHAARLGSLLTAGTFISSRAAF